MDETEKVRCGRSVRTLAGPPNERRNSFTKRGTFKYASILGSPRVFVREGTSRCR